MKRQVDETNPRFLEQDPTRKWIDAKKKRRKKNKEQKKARRRNRK